MDEDEQLPIDNSSPNAPLLGGDSSAEGQSRESLKPWHIVTAPSAISAVACIGIFLWVLSGMIIIVPAARLAEDILCRRHYGRVDSDPIDEELCKAEEIQSSMAWIFGLTISLGTVVGLVVMIPYGVLADRARKPVYLLAAVGQFANVAWSLLALRFWTVIPIELIVLGPVLELIGGGLTMAGVVLYAIISDVNAPENRAIIYFFSALAANVAVFIGPPLASKMIQIWSPWVPMSLSLVATTLAGSIILLIPETAHRTELMHRDDGSRAGANDQGWRVAIKSQVAYVFSHSNLRSLLNKRSVILLLLVSFLTAPLRLGTGTIFLQYYSKRFGKPIENGGYMLAIRGGLTIVVVGVLLPVLSKCIGPSSYFRLSAFRRDLVLAQGSAAVAGLGYYFLGGPDSAFLISGIIILSLSTGIGPLSQSLISNLVAPGQTSQVFTIASIVEGMGSLPAGPFLAWTFSYGIRLGGLWLGLPFFFLGSLGFLALAVLCFIDAKPGTTDLDAGDEED
ncbi:MFS general substrate transporter [Xylaria sp. FL0933]|nr:MFS general substrate transporter [Xylaria sp. FL0933]